VTSETQCSQLLVGSPRTSTACGSLIAKTEMVARTAHLDLSPRLELGFSAGRIRKKRHAAQGHKGLLVQFISPLKRDPSFTGFGLTNAVEASPLDFFDDNDRDELLVLGNRSGLRGRPAKLANRLALLLIQVSFQPSWKRHNHRSEPGQCGPGLFSRFLSTPRGSAAVTMRMTRSPTQERAGCRRRRTSSRSWCRRFVSR
jgi:hypothetical protein